MRQRLIPAGLLLALLLAPIAACDDDPAAPAPWPLDQHYLFDAYYVNFAWGYQLNGTYIDDRGHVIRYDHGFEVWTAEDFDSLTAAELDQKYSGPADTLGTIDAATLRAMAGLIEAAAAGELSDRVLTAMDAGSTAHVCYRYEAASGRYERVLLSLTGSYTQTNLCPAGQLLDAWLHGVLEETNTP